MCVVMRTSVTCTGVRPWLVPGPSVGRGKAWYSLCVHAPNFPTLCVCVCVCVCVFRQVKYTLWTGQFSLTIPQAKRSQGKHT